jgi:LPS export ABC transporter protein LptC/lipopolysaccharide transport protein LptA
MKVLTLTSKHMTTLLLAAWVGIVVLWPERTDNEIVQNQTPALTSGESLYKADLTKTNFGLLGVHFYESSENKPKWDIRSRFAELNRREDYFYLQQVNAEFFGRESGNVIRTVSDYGRSYLSRNFIELEGNVVVVSSQGYEFRMQRLDYNGANRTFFSDSFVSMKGPDILNPVMVLEGNGMKGSADKEQFTVQKNVQARRKMSTAEWLHIRSVSGDFYTSEQRAVFHRRVRAQLPKVTIQSDRFELQTADGQETIIANGHVTLYNRERTGSADKATVQIGDDRILLEGGAKITTDNDTMMGDQILIYSEDDRVEVKSAQGVMRR